MNQIEQYSAQLDLCVAQLRKEAPYGINPALLRLSALAEAIDTYRKQAEGIISLDTEVMSERLDQIVALEDLVVERNTTITQLRELVESTEAECDEVAQISSRTIEDLNGVVADLRSTLEVSQAANRKASGLRSQLDAAQNQLRASEEARCEWQEDAKRSDDHCERLATENVALRTQIEAIENQNSILTTAYQHQQGLIAEARNETNKIIGDREDAYAMLDEAHERIGELQDHGDNEFPEVGERNFSIDPGTPEGDKTIIDWTCTCGMKRVFVAPKHTDWSHETPCQCGSTTTLRL